MSKPKLLADENLERDLVNALKRRGFDIRYAKKGLGNSELLAIAESEGRVLVTHDHDFLRVELYKSSKGVIVLPVLKIEEMVKILVEFLERVEAKELEGKAFLLRREFSIENSIEE